MSVINYFRINIIVNRNIIIHSSFILK